jgi:hypothetical protein
MDVTGASSRLSYAQLPTSQDMATMLAARPSMAQMSSKALAETADQQTQVADSMKALSSGNRTGQVDMYM